MMAASQTTNVLDPMYNFDTHFPERLSSLHIHGDNFNQPPNSFRKKKSSRNRTGARYKTQPVTFDEILEVDEEPLAASSSSSAVKDVSKRASSSEHIIGQLQAFSRSMDGLVPMKGGVFPEHVVQRHVSLSRSGSRKYQRHPECIPERVESEPQSPKQKQEGEQAQQVSTEVQQQQKQETAEQRLGGEVCASKAGDLTTGSPTASSASSKNPLPTLAVPTVGEGESAGVKSPSSPIPSPNIAPRRQKITAKAKKRQKAQGEGDGNQGNQAT